MNSNNTASLYGMRSSGGHHGDVFTSPRMVCYMLDQVGYDSHADLRNIRILEPSCGEGEFVLEIARRLLRSAAYHHFDANEAFQRNVRAYDIDGTKIECCRRRLTDIGIYPSPDNLQAADFLTCRIGITDVVVGNPPYVRYEHIPQNMRDYCRNNFSTFHYRCDLYVPFFEKTLSLLSKGGRHCFICSNRWLKNEYGKKLRKLIAQKYAVKMIVGLEQADAFQEEVLAYPSITVIGAGKPSAYFDYAEVRQVEELAGMHISKRISPTGDDWTRSFSSVAADHALKTIEQQGFKIGIGAATGADAIFVSSDLPDRVESELILPSIKARDLRGNQFNWHGDYLLNPYNSDGSLIDLADYPLAGAYLEQHRERLTARHVARKSPAKWYKTIDRISPCLQKQPKILLPDMSGNTFVFVDDGSYYPLHSIYYITGQSSVRLRLLAAFLMSDFVRDQLSAVTNAMNGGFSRWQSQHLRKLRIPDINAISATDTQQILSFYECKEISSINHIINRLYGA